MASLQGGLLKTTSVGSLAGQRLRHCGPAPDKPSQQLRLLRGLRDSGATNSGGANPFRRLLH